MIRLYINGMLADLDDSVKVAMNYIAEDTSSPTAVKNSYSQQITLKGTPANNKIFGCCFRNDRKNVQGTGFYPLERTPFVLMSETSEVIESGYCKLDSISSTSTSIDYKVTLYGGLGSFLYGLMYDAEGNKKTLASLNYGTDLTFQINKDSIKDAWQTLAGSKSIAKWGIINFAPCYNGIPEGNFEASKALADASVLGLPASVSDGGNTYYTREGNILIDLGSQFDEWAVKDLRSYLQRPVIKMSKLLDAICNTANNGGYQVNLDNTFFKTSNPYYDKTWLTLSQLTKLNIEAGKTGTTAMNPSGAAWTADTTESWAMATDYTARHFAASVSLGVHAVPQTPTLAAMSMGRLATYIGSGAGMVRNVIAYQLVAKDANGNIIGGSKVVSAQSVVRDYQGNTPDYYSPTWKAVLNTEELQLTPAYGNLVEMAGTTYVGVFKDRMGSGTMDFCASDGTDIDVQLSLDCDNAASFVLYKWVQSYGYGAFADNTNTLAVFDISSASQSPLLLDNYMDDGNGSAAWNDTTDIRTGATIAQSLLLGGTSTPADYLLSYCKMFGLRIVCDNASKTISILSRNSFYNGSTINIDGRIDRTSGFSTTPIPSDANWYVWKNNTLAGSYADYYKKIHGIEYGAKKVNTGYVFDANTKQLLAGSAFNDAPAVSKKSRYNYNVTNNGKVAPAPILDSKCKATYYNGNGSHAVDYNLAASSTLRPFNQSYMGYDCEGVSRIQLHNDSNAAVDGKNVLVMYNGGSYAEYGKFCITDDNAIMTAILGNPCWLVEQSTLASGYAISASLPLPTFTRHMMNGSQLYCLLEMGTPVEIDMPAVSVTASSDVYSFAWSAYTADRYDADTRIVECSVNLGGLQVGWNMLHQFYFFDNAIWVLNKISDYVAGADGLTKCEFIKVQNKSNYSNGQTY